MTKIFKMLKGRETCSGFTLHFSECKMFLCNEYGCFIAFDLSPILYNTKSKKNKHHIMNPL